MLPPSHSWKSTHLLPALLLESFIKKTQETVPQGAPMTPPADQEPPPKAALVSSPADQARAWERAKRIRRMMHGYGIISASPTSTT